MRRLLMLATMTVAFSVSAMEPEELTCGSKFEKRDDIDRCFSEAVTSTEKDLDTIQKALIKSLVVAREKLQADKPEPIVAPDQKLQAIDEPWRAYRSANCAYYELAYAPVSEASTERIVCVLRMTRQRLRELREENEFWVYKFKDRETAPNIVPQQ